MIARGISGLRFRSVIAIAILAVGLIQADRLTSLAEEELFADPIVYSQTTPYQRIVITRGRAGFQLFLNGNLQFSSADEYRYHEALVHPAMSLAGSPRNVLVLGGGDGLAVREILKHPSVEHVTLVDLDPDMTRLSTRFSPLGDLNGHSLTNPRVTVVNADAMIWLDTARGGKTFDVAIVDFPDPSTFALGKLYTTRFYRLLRVTAAGRGRCGYATAHSRQSSLVHHFAEVRAAGFAVRPIIWQYAHPFSVWQEFALQRRRAVRSADDDDRRFADSQRTHHQHVQPRTGQDPLPV